MSWKGINVYDYDKYFEKLQFSFSILRPELITDLLMRFWIGVWVRESCCLSPKFGLRQQLTQAHTPIQSLITTSPLNSKLVLKFVFRCCPAIRISGFHPEDPGSFPGNGTKFGRTQLTVQRIY